MNEIAQSTAGATHPTVLVVEPDGGSRERYGEWLEAAGFHVVNCPGPQANHLNCLGVRGLPCPLNRAADIVLLDTRALPGVGRKEKAGWRLVRYYLRAGKPLVILADRYRPDRTFRPEQVAVMQADPGVESLLLAVRRMMAESRRW
jgi:hypothetical protein